jgi:cell wall-associated NlpC family hydrolase
VTLIAWFIMVIGGYLTATAVANKDPKATLVSLLKGDGVPSAVWYQPPSALVGGTGSSLGSVSAEGAKRIGEILGANGTGATIGQARQVVVGFAMAQLGEPYQFGASGPSRWDCSGLTMRAYEQVGIRLPHHAASQQKAGHNVSSSEALPGDLIFWGPVSGHVAMYLGNGQMIHAPHSGDVVRVSGVSDTKRARYRSYL